METSQPTTTRCYRTEKDTVKRLREIHFFVLSSENFIWVWHVKQWWTELLASLYYLLSGNVGPSAWCICRLSLSAECARSYKGSEWKWASGYRWGRSPDHRLILKHDVVQSILWVCEKDYATPTFLRIRTSVHREFYCVNIKSTFSEK